MKLKHPALVKTVGLLGSVVGRVLRRTIDWRAVYFDPLADTVCPGPERRYVYCGWHEYMLMPILLRGDRRMLALASEHSDGEYIARAMKHLGWSLARGSSTRGGAKALMRMLHEQRAHLSLTPDGPRGPRREMSQGPIVLASKLGLPVVCVGYAYDRPFRTRSWDKFAIPRPFSRARAVFGPPLTVPARLGRDDLERYCQWFGDLLNWLTAEAESWAESGAARPGSMPMLLKEAPPAMRRGAPLPAMSLPADLAARWAALQDRKDAGRKAA